MNFEIRETIFFIGGFLIVFLLFYSATLMKEHSKPSSEVLENFLKNEFCGGKAFGVSKCVNYYLVNCGSFVDLPEYIVDEKGEVICTISWGKWYCSRGINAIILRNEISECKPI